MEKTDESFSRAIKMIEDMFPDDKKTYEQYEREFRMIEDMFPNAKFNVCIPIEDLDNIITDEKEIIVIQKIHCYCYKRKRTKYFTIKCNENEFLTNKYIITELMNQKMKMQCNHRFLEEIHKNKENIYEIYAGS